MKVYTVQHNDFLDREYEDGSLAPIFHPETSIFHEKTLCNALYWMKDKYEEKIMASETYFDLIWVWPKLKWAFQALQDENTSIFVFEVPIDVYKNKILWSDFIDWHMVLNQIDYDYDSIFDVNLKKSKFPTQGVLIELRKEWFIKKIKYKKKKGI